MEDEIKTEQNEQLTADDYLANLSALKNTTVSKEEYARILEENRKLADALANGLPYEQKDDSEPDPVDIDALRKSLFIDHKYNSDLDYFKDVLKLREALMEQGQADPFLPNHPDYVPNEHDSERAQFIADELQAAIDYADGDKDVFKVELQRRCGVKNKR